MFGLKKKSKLANSAGKLGFGFPILPLIIDHHKLVMKIRPPKKIHVEKVQKLKLRNFYVGKSFSPESMINQ